MTIYELEKQATPGPWQEYIGLAVDNPCLGRVLVACDACNTNSTLADRKAADMKLTAHCRNNYLRALEALKNAQMEIAIASGYGDNRGPICSPEWEARERLIDELETIS